jgi:hypothetical protein
MILPVHVTHRRWQISSKILNGDKKAPFIRWLHYRKLQVVFIVFPVSLKTFIETPNCLAADRQGHEDTRLTLTPSVIPNSNYVIMVSD